MKYLLSLFIFAFLAAGPAVVVFAAQGSGVGGDTIGSGPGGNTTGSGLGSKTITIDNPLAADNITELFQTIIDIVLIFAVPVIVFFIIYAGFLYVTARGNEATIQKAHMALLYALIGGLLILGARVLIDVISGTVDVFRE